MNSLGFDVRRWMGMYTYFIHLPFWVCKIPVVTTHTHSCGQRILFNISFGEATACQSVAERYPDICGSCSSLHCPISSTPTPSPVVPMDDTTTIPTLPTIAITTPGATCGCYACDESILNKSVGEARLTCGQRIESLRSRTGGRSFSEVEACYQVSEEFPNDCGPAW